MVLGGVAHNLKDEVDSIGETRKSKLDFKSIQPKKHHSLPSGPPPKPLPENT